MTRRYRKHPQTAGRVVDGLAFVVTAGDNKLHQLNLPATELWTLAARGCTLDEAVAHLVERFEVEPRTAAADARECLDDLVDRRILEVDEAPAPPPRPRYDQAAAGYDEAHGDRRSRLRFARIEAPMLAACRHARRVLEIGVGTGRLLSRVEAPMRVGVDVSREMLARAVARGGLHLVRADAHALPFAAASFDAVLAGKGVFRYLDPVRAFAECARVLRPGGRLALHQYAADTWSWRRVLGRDVPDPEVRRLHVERVDDLEALARAAGLVPVVARLFRSVPFYPYAARVPRRAAGRLWSHVVLVCRRPWR